VLGSIPSPDNGTIDLGPLPLHAYGLMLAIGVIVATLIAERRWVARGYDREAFMSIVVWVVIAGVVGARVYHLFTGYDWDQDGIVGAFEIWKGGLSIWGAVGGGFIAVVVLSRLKHLDTLALMDCIAPGLFAAQAIGRWGNWFNQELFGKPSDLPWALEISPANRPLAYLDQPTFHPTFLYESLYCLIGLAVLLLVERWFRLRKGQAFALYVALYTFGRFFLENLRVDPSEKLGPLRFNAWVSVVLFVTGVTWFIWLGRRGREYPRRRQQESGSATARLPS
jgi:phosphatidylglycerol---prolipoprotein diacylglyceryl transferase